MTFHPEDRTRSKIPSDGMSNELIGAATEIVKEPIAKDWNRLWGLHTPATLRDRARQLGAANQLIEGLVPARSLGLVLGDSGIGKSSLMYQVAICVASGIPFLGRKTRKAPVVMADFENGIDTILEMIDRISAYLGLPEAPCHDELLLWTINDCPTNYGGFNHTLVDMLRDVKPGLAIIDSLGSYAAGAEDSNRAANETIARLRFLARDAGTASYLVHHRRKPSRKADEVTGPLESANIRQWFEDARGASALVNSTDVRLGVSEPDISVVQKDEVALVVRGFARVQGEVNSLYLSREHDESGDPVGYRLLCGPELLFNHEQQRAFEELPAEFSFKQAKQVYGKSDQPARNWLLRLISLGLLHQVGRGAYQKRISAASTGENDGAHGETQQV